MRLLLFLGMLLFFGGATINTYAHDPNEHVLMDSEDVSKALSNDDLAGAKRAGSKLAEDAKKANQAVVTDHASQLAKSSSLDDARTHFKAISQETEKLAKGKEGYYIMTCPMENADWVQTTKQIANPYLGKQMPNCGSVKQ